MSDETASQPRIKVSWLFATLLAFAIFVVVGIYSKRMANDYPDYDQQRAEIRKQNLAKVQAAEGALLNPVDAHGQPIAEWVDEGKGIVRIPIEEAMAKEIGDLQAKAPAMGNALPVAAPAPAPATNAPAANKPGSPAPANKPPAPPTPTNK